MASKKSKTSKKVAGIGLVIVIVVGLMIATVPEIREPLMNIFQIGSEPPVMLTAFQIETLDNDCFSNQVLKLAGCKYDLQNDFRDLSLSLDTITFQTRISFFDEPIQAQRNIWVLTGDCISSNFIAQAIDQRIRIDFLIGRGDLDVFGQGEDFGEQAFIVEECVDRVVFDTSHWGLKVVDGERVFVRTNTFIGCTMKVPPPPLDSGESDCVDSDGDGIFDGYDELQTECRGILGVDCLFTFNCQFEILEQEGRDPHLRNCQFNLIII